MKTKVEYDLALKDISIACQKHGVFLMGTCINEGIYGEISIGLTGDKDSHSFTYPENLCSDVEVNTDQNMVSVEIIGTV